MGAGTFILREGGKLASSFLRTIIIKASPVSVAEEESEEKTVTPREIGTHVPLPTSDETAVELKRRLAKELYRAELDLAAGLKIAGKSCDCLSNKHTLMLEAAAEELISQEPGNPVYQEIIDWIGNNRSKVTPEAIQSGKHASEYPYMANEFKNFRKRVMGSAADSTNQPQFASNSPKITLEEAKKMAAEEAAREVEKAWNKGG